MKKIFYLLLASFMLLASACKEEEDVNSISTDDAAEITAAAIGNSSGGAISYIGASADLSATATSTRSASVATNIEYPLGAASASDNGLITSASSGNIGTWSYTWSYSHVLVVNPNLVPLEVKSNFDYNGKVDVPRFNSDHNGWGKLVYTSLGTGVINLDVAGSFVVDSLWTMNGTFYREATHKSKATNKEMNSKTTITFDDCEVYTDGSRKIKSGTAIVNIKGSVPRKGDFEYNGTISFNQYSVGTLSIDGKTYTISLASGEIIE